MASALASLPLEGSEMLKDLLLGLRSVGQAADSLRDRAQEACRRLLYAARDAMRTGDLPERGLEVLGDGAPDVVATGRRLSAGLGSAPQYLFWYLLLGDEVWPASFRAWRDEVRAGLLSPEELDLLPSTRRGDRFGVWKVYRDPARLTTVMDDRTPGGAVSRETAQSQAEKPLVVPLSVTEDPEVGPRAEQIPVDVPPVELTTDRWSVPEQEQDRRWTFVGWRAVRERVPVFFSLVPLTDAELADLTARLEREGVEAPEPPAARERAILDATVDVLLASGSEPAPGD